MSMFCTPIVQIPPSTAYAPPMKRPIEEEETNDDKSPNKKKKKLQKKCKTPTMIHSRITRLFSLSLSLEFYILKIVSPGPEK